MVQVQGLFQLYGKKKQSTLMQKTVVGSPLLGESFDDGNDSSWCFQELEHY